MNTFWQSLKDLYDFEETEKTKKLLSQTYQDVGKFRSIFGDGLNVYFDMGPTKTYIGFYYKNMFMSISFQEDKIWLLCDNHYDIIKPTKPDLYRGVEYLYRSFSWLDRTFLKLYHFLRTRERIPCL